MPSQNIRDIIQDRYGFIWLATDNGLVKYDGFQFKVFGIHPGREKGSLTEITEDRRGDFWVGTMNSGLFRFDRQQERFISYLSADNFMTGIPDTTVMTLYSDSQNRVWVGTYSQGLFRYDDENDTFVHVAGRANPNTRLSSNYITDIIEDTPQRFWVGTYNGLHCFNAETGEVKPFLVSESDHTPPQYRITTLMKNKQGELLMGALGHKLLKFDPATGKTREIALAADNRHIASVISLFEDEHGWLWAGTSGTGLFLINPESKQSTQYQAESTHYNHIGASMISRIYQDHSGAIWIGSQLNGLKLTHLHRNPFHAFQHHPQDPGSLANNWITSAFEDGDQRLWLGCGEGILEEMHEDGTFTHHAIPGIHDGPYPQKMITALTEDARGRLWLGSYYGLIQYDKKGRVIQRYQRTPDGLPSNIISDLAFDADQTLWIATRFRGACCFNPRTETFKNYLTPPNINPVGSNIEIFDILVDSQNRKWISSSQGLYQYNKQDDRFILCPLDTPLAINSIHEDQNHWLWLSTANSGVFQYNPCTRELKRFPFESDYDMQGSNCLVQDSAGCFWMATDKGILRFNPTDSTQILYDFSYGIRYYRFNPNALVKTHDGDLLFGSFNGLLRFSPDQFIINPHPPRLALTDLKIFNQQVSIGPSGPLTQSVETLNELNLKHWQNDITLEFSAMHYFMPEKNRYAFYLENYEKQWRHVKTQKHATYTNLSPGHYVFHLKAANSDGVWTKEGIQLPLTVYPPLWKTWYAYLFYALLTITLLAVLRRYENSRLKLKHHLALNKAETEKLKELDRMKTRFFTNISHEFRTPLTLILGPLNTICSGEDVDNPGTLFQMMRRNALRLQRLINQLLDISRLEAGKLKLDLVQDDLCDFLKPVVQSFQSLAQQKKIDFQDCYPSQPVMTAFDQDKIEKIVTNLLSNAFKFTPQNGLVRFVLKSDAQEVVFIVEDTGIGIPPQHLSDIFRQFHQVESSHSRGYEGSGVGLALTKELVELHDGTIHVESHPQRGSIFTVTLPVRAGTQDGETAPPARSIQKESQKKPEPVVPPETQTPAPPPCLIHIVEDNRDLRQFMSAQLGREYRVMESENGAAGLAAAALQMPDLIITDIMMPEMDGIEFCQRLKADVRTSHIPVIMLTAQISDEVKMKGLETGADEYITKPFDSRELAIRIRNLINHRNRLRDQFRREWILKPAAIAVTSTDDAFLQRVKSCIDNNLNDVAFSVEDLARTVGMSRVQLYRKIRALTGQTASEIIKSFRLKRAAQLLKQNSDSVAGISFLVGFNEPSYFSKCFKEQYGLTPTEFIHNNRDESKQANSR